MSVLGNIIWLIFGGLIAGAMYMIFGAVLCITIVGIPFGLQAIRLGRAVLAPFGKQVSAAENPSTLKLVFDVIWIVLFGWEIAITHLTFAAVLAITIVGLPFAKQHVKLARVALLPFGARLS